MELVLPHAHHLLSSTKILVNHAIVPVRLAQVLNPTNVPPALVPSSFKATYVLKHVALVNLLIQLHRPVTPVIHPAQHAPTAHSVLHANQVRCFKLEAVLQHVYLDSMQIVIMSANNAPLVVVLAIQLQIVRHVMMVINQVELLVFQDVLLDFYLVIKNVWLVQKIASNVLARPFVVSVMLKHT
jgi:hypothetical protein